MTRFDKKIERKNTNSLKYDFAAEFRHPDDLIPLWVADMDFEVPEAVKEKLKEIAEFGIYGYSDVKEDYKRTVTEWFAGRFGFAAETDWIVPTPGVVFALNLAIRAYTEPGEGILIQPPVYYPFAASIRDNGRCVVENALIYENGRYQMDFQDLEQKITDHQVKMMVLCSPHNPVGRVWSEEELRRLGEICLKHGVLVVSDEIHCDFTYEGHTHTVFAGLSDAIREQSVVFTAPSKTFNLAGLQVSNVFIPNPELRSKFKLERRRTGYDEMNIFAPAACQAAYACGAEWLEELKQYLTGNLNYVRTYLEERIPEIRLVEPEGTYLLWLDCSGLALTDEALERLMVEDAKLWLDKGSMFHGLAGQFERVNIACPKSLLEQAMAQLEAAVKGLRAARNKAGSAGRDTQA